VEYVIAEMDGAMIPIVDTFNKTDEEGKTIDKRKTREVRWTEGRLSLAHPKGSVTPVFGATLGDQDEAGNQLAHCAILSGAGEQTKVHCVGDGAPWICDQVDRVFGPQAGFLIDFYHLCDYLAAASKRCAPDHPSAWLEEQKQRMKENNGAWWKEDNAQNMLGLRTLRANNKWDQYWESFYKKAA